MDRTVVSVPSAALTASGNSGALRMPQGNNLSVLMNCTAVSGTSPSMTVTVEWSHDGVNFAQGDPADTFTAITAAANKVARFNRKGPVFRIVWTISGTTPSFTTAFTAVADGSGFAY